MYPDLFTIGTFTIHTYGVCIALGAFLGIFMISRDAKRQGFDQQQVLDLAFYLLVSAIIGSRVFYILLNLRYFLTHPEETVMIWRGGLVFYGGFIFAFASCYFSLKRHDLPFLKTCDLLVPGLALGEVCGRIGCFFAGCCYGTTTDAPWAVIFTHPHSLALKNVPLHPTQLYASLKALIIFLALVIYRRYKRRDGQIIWLYVFLYAIGRLLIEQFRGDERGLLVFGHFSVAQVIALCFIPLALFFFFFTGRKAASPS